MAKPEIKMNLEDDPNSKRRVLVTPDSEREASILVDAIAPRALFRYFKAFKSLSDRRFGEEMPTVNFTKGQLRWIGKRVAPWEKHPILILPEKQNVIAAHNMAIEIAEYLDQPTGLAKGG